MKAMTIILAAGGSGGHLYPAQALASELAHRGATIVVMTDARGTQYPSFFPDARIEIVPAAAFSDRSFIRLVTAPFEILAGIVTALAKLGRIKPAAVVGFGGYPSLPVMIAACLARFPTAIVAPDAVVGRANRIVANYVRVIAGGLPLKRFLPRDMSKVVYTGTPLRPDVVAHSAAPYDTPQANGPLRLLVFGGSQGARALSEIVPAAIALLSQPLRVRLDIVQQCVALAKPVAEKNKIALETKIDLPPTALVAGDIARLRQAVSCLLQNAVKFTPPGGRVALDAWISEERFHLAISDTGVGVKPEDIAVITRPFHRLRSALDGNHQGAGLGLPFAKAIVELHGGSLAFESVVNKGTLVTVILPVLSDAQVVAA